MDGTVSSDATRLGHTARMHGRAPDFRLYHGNSLEVLAGLLAEALRKPAPGQALLAPELVLIPQVAMRRWLQATLAQAHGIAANLEFLTPGEFVRRALDANRSEPGDGHTGPGQAGQEHAGQELDAEQARWRLYAALSEPAALREPALRELRGYLQAAASRRDGQPAADPLKAWLLAGELAGVFENYQAWRRDWLLDWDAGRAPREPQAALWRRIAAGRQHRARRIVDYLARFGGAEAADVPAPLGLPPRLFVFATLNVSPDVLRVIATQARAGTLHCYLPTPTRKYWGDLRTLAERLRDGEACAFDADDNPLLQAWGAAGRDFMAVLGGYEVVHPSAEFAAYAEPTGDGLLAALQRDLLERRAPADPPVRATVDVDDPSLQLHACPTRLREVQVLHDQLRGLLEDPRFDPPLQPREIAVLAPDIDPYAPHIAAVFGGLRGQAGFIPYALADASPLAAEPLAEVFLRLLALPVSRFGLNEVLDLLATPLIAEQAGLDAPALDRVHAWLQAAGARWGLDAAHRARHDAPLDDACTWSFALDRLLLGHASGDDAPIAGVAPWPQLEGGALEALDAVLRLLRVLARHERAFASAMPPVLWRERLLGLLDALLPKRPRDPAGQAALERLHGLIQQFADGADSAGFEHDLPVEVVRAHFQARLGEVDARAPLLSGGVSFGRMVPMRLIPFRAICLLGMNDGEYPRRDPMGGLDQIAHALATPARRPGDRSLRDDDRFLFLQLFAAAADVFYVSWLGMDPRDGSAREPSVLVAELLDVAARYHAAAGLAREALLVRHPLQPFAPAAFGADAEAGHEPRRFSYRQAWRPAAEAVEGRRDPLPAWVSTALPAPDAVAVLSLAQLRRFLRDPADAFLRQRLALRLPDDTGAGSDVEPLVLPGRGRERQALQQAVFEACVRGDTTQLHAALRARALLPSGPLGRRQLEALRDEIEPYAQAFVRWRDGEAQVRSFELELDGVRLHGSLDALYPHGLARLRFDTLHGPAQIAHGLDWLVLSALGIDRPLVQFAQFATATTGLDVGPQLRPALAPEPARAALRTLLALRADGLREPLPFLPRAGWRWYDAVANGKDGWPPAEQQWRGGARVWAEAGTPAAQLALRGRDPFNDAALGERFRAIATQVFDAVVHGRSDGGAA